MKHLALLAAVYALIAALVVPSSLFASEDANPTPAETPATEPAPAEEAPAAPPEPAVAPQEPAQAPQQPAPAPEQPAAAPEQAAAPAPAEQPAPKRKKRASAKAAASGSVTISDFQFAPAQITINQGDSVTWTNNGPTPHSATAPDGSFDTGIFPKGQSRSHTFNDAGTFSYICTPHPNMQGTIVVQASQSGDTPDSSTGDTDGSGSTAGDDSSGAEAAQSDGGPSLPSTGTDAGALVLLGALMLLLGVAVHRRARADEPRPAGRIGW